LARLATKNFHLPSNHVARATLQLATPMHPKQSANLVGKQPTTLMICAHLFGIGNPKTPKDTKTSRIIAPDLNYVNLLLMEL